MGWVVVKAGSFPDAEPGEKRRLRPRRAARNRARPVLRGAGWRAVTGGMPAAAAHRSRGNQALSSPPQPPNEAPNPSFNPLSQTLTPKPQSWTHCPSVPTPLRPLPCPLEAVAVPPSHYTPPPMLIWWSGKLCETSGLDCDPTMKPKVTFSPCQRIRCSRRKAGPAQILSTVQYSSVKMSVIYSWTEAFCGEFMSQQNSSRHFCCFPKTSEYFKLKISVLLQKISFSSHFSLLFKWARLILLSLLQQFYKIKYIFSWYLVLISQKIQARGHKHIN